MAAQFQPVWLDVPYADNAAAKAAGARFDGNTRRWYAPTPEAAANLQRWIPAPGAEPAAKTPVRRVWLDVPYDERDEAKAAGARWDGTARRWYAPTPTNDLARWAAAPELPQVLPGEDRSYGSRLYIDLVPSNCWFTNVRSCVSQRDWDRIRRMCNQRAGYRCEICGQGADKDADRRLEVHERWSYETPSLVQRLRRLILLCSDCHRTSHYGYAMVRGQEQEAFDHLQKVTGMSPAQAANHVRQAFKTHDWHECLTWRLDISILTNAGIEVTPPPAADRRLDIAATVLDAERNDPNFQSTEHTARSLT